MILLTDYVASVHTYDNFAGHDFGRPGLVGRKPILGPLPGKNAVIEAIDAGHYIKTITTEVPGGKGKRPDVLATEVCRACQQRWPCREILESRELLAQRTRHNLGAVTSASDRRADASMPTA